MKTILRIIMILLVASTVAGAFSLVVNNSSTTTTTNEAGAPPAIATANGQSVSRPMTRPEGGDRDSGSLTGGVAGMLATLAKITGITILVLVTQKGFSQLGNFKLKSAQS